MIRNFSKVLTVLLALAASSCSYQTIDVKDGQIPSEYHSYLTPFLGTYVATSTSLFSSPSGDVTLTLNGDRILVSTTMDLLGKGCGSSIGQLERIFVENQNGTASVGSAIFALDVGQCLNVEGRTVDFVSNSQGLFMQVLIQSGDDHGQPAQYLEYRLVRKS